MQTNLFQKWIYWMDAMVIFTVRCEDVTKETVKKCFVKFRISPKDQASSPKLSRWPFHWIKKNHAKIEISWLR